MLRPGGGAGEDTVGWGWKADLAKHLARMCFVAQIGMHQAKTTLSQLVERALEGEEIVLTRRGVPAVRLVPERAGGGFATLAGVWEGQVRIAEDFDELPEDFAERFGLKP
jgi:prevent-host-death family protein